MPTMTRTAVRLSGLLMGVGVLVPIGLPLAAAAPRAASRPMTPASACALRSDVQRQADPTLGAGVGISTGHEGNLYPAGARTALHVSQPTSGPATQQIRLSVSSETRAVGTRQAPLHRTPVPASGVPATRTVSVPNRPGWYQVRAERVSGGRVLGVSCLWYGVAMPGSTLNLDTLPVGKDWGGAGPLRDVALHHELGLSIVRYQLDVADFLNNPRYADPDLSAAAARAHQLGIRFVVAIGQGGAAETAAVKNGSWAHLVRRIVATYPAVTYWVPWNEPNSGQCFYGTARTYVDRVLVPALHAVHAAHPGALVVGGSAVSDDSPWWRRFAALGGFHDLDVIGVHPYTANLGAPESHGLLSVLHVVHQLAHAHGAAGKPIFDTESAWPSSYPDAHATLATQSDFVARKLVLERSLGVSSGEYLVEGGWQDWDLIDYFRGVKPAALALSATATLLAHRHFLGWVTTNVPHVWAARFSAATSGGHQLIVTWSSGGTRTVHLSCPGSGFTTYGATMAFHGQIHASGALSFLSLPAGSHCLS
jgi:hypothetical protein